MYGNAWPGFAAGLAVVLLVACRAPGQDPDAIQEAAARDGDLTLAGCLQHDVETGRFVLANALLASEPAGAPLRDETAPPDTMVGAPSTRGTLPAALEGPRYIVDPPAEANLQAHVNMQVQITGRLDPADADDRPVGTTGPDVGTRDYGRDVEGRIVADEVRLVAETCL